MSLALFNAVPAGAIEVIFYINNQPWFKRADLGRYLGIIKIRDSFTNFQAQFLKRREEILGAGSTGSLGRYKNSTDIFLSVDGAIEVAVRSKKPMASELARWLARKGVEKIQEEHQLAIEEKDHQHQLTITQFQENLHQSNNQLQAITYQNQDLVHEIQELRQRYVAPLMNSRKNNIIIIIRKHTISDNDKYHHYPYYIARIQKRKRYIKLRWFQRYFPQHEIIVELDCANSIVSFNRFEEDGFVERKYNNFRLLQDLTRDDLYDMGIPAIDYEDED